MRTGNTNHAEPIANNTEPAYILHKTKNVSCETELTMPHAGLENTSY